MEGCKVTYQVLIENSDKPGASITFDHVLEYRMDGIAFYMAGTDFQEWYIAKPGDEILVTEKT